MQALLVPIDDRPVTYTFPQMLGRIAGIHLLAPPRQLLGSLKRPAQPEQLVSWVDSSLQKSVPEGLLMSLDSLLYGGLINSRRSPDTLSDVQKRVSNINRWRQRVGTGCPILAQASIMRVSDNYDATEEKEYWARFGREIFAWSGYLHRLSRGDKLAAGVLNSAEQRIPKEIRDDYLKTRWRNFQINRQLLEFVASGAIDFLVFSLDDSGEFGLNVHEQERILNESLSLSGHIASYAGADEVVCALLARWLVSSSGAVPSVNVQFSPPSVNLCPSRYEGQSVGHTIAAQIEACGLKTTQDGGDFTVIIHGSNHRQGDHILLPGQQDLRDIDTREAVNETIALLESTDGPVVLCDVAYANGADPRLVEKLLERGQLLSKLWAYAGWNTTGNTAGSALAMGVACWFASRSAGGSLPKSAADALKQALFVRLADDWAYQAVTRRELSRPIELSALAERMDPLFKRIAQALQYQPAGLRLGFPWERTFEIEIVPAELNYI